MTSAGFTELEHLRVRVRLLQGIATHINSGLDAKQLVERTLLEAHNHLSEFRLSYCALDPTSGEMMVVSSVSPLNMSSIQGLRFALKEAKELAVALRTGAHVAVADIETDDRMVAFRQTARAHHAQALLYVPIPHSSGATALVGLSSPVPHVWSSHELEMLVDMAGYLAIAIREASMQQEREEMNRQLRESQKMEALGRLVGGVAHDFNNLLTGMMIYSGLLSTALGGSSPLQRHVREIQTAGERGASLVAQLLSLTRTHVLEAQVLSLNDVVGGMREMLQRLVGEEVRIDCQLAADLRSTRLDENLLRQSILNLAINARDAMPAGGSLIFRTSLVTADDRSAKRVPGLQPGTYAVLSVSDDGVGMSPETLLHCFEPFYTTKAIGQGTGLGLASVYGMVLQHGGYIAVKSLPEQGTTFDLYFPVVQGTDIAMAGEGGRRETILLVEDEEMLRLPLTEQLEAEGYYVLSAAAGEAAILAAADFGGVIHVLVTDLVMPGMSGVELAGLLGKQRPEMRVLFMSGYTNDLRARQLIAEGAEFLRKPFDASTFGQRVRELLEHTRVGWPPPAQISPSFAAAAGKFPEPNPERQLAPLQNSISSLQKRDIE